MATNRQRRFCQPPVSYNILSSMKLCIKFYCRSKGNMTSGVVFTHLYHHWIVARTMYLKGLLIWKPDDCINGLTDAKPKALSSNLLHGMAWHVQVLWTNEKRTIWNIKDLKTLIILCNLTRHTIWVATSKTQSWNQR